MTDELIGGATLVEALVRAQAQMPKLTKGETAKIQTRQGGEFSYSYASLDSILDAVQPVLSRHGLAIIQEPGFTDNGPYAGHTLTTTLLHESGETRSSTMRVPIADPNDPKALGSGLTYARRYAILAVLALAPDDDDDGTAAGQKKAEPKKQPAVKNPADEGQMRAISLTTKLLQDAHPDAAGGGKSWKQVAWQYAGEKLGLDKSGVFTKKQANDLNQWLEDTFRELNDPLPSDAAEPTPEDVDKAAEEAITGPPEEASTDA